MTINPLKIALVSQWYTPEPVPLPHDIAVELQRRGHVVNVVTAFPNYPSGKIYSGHSQRWRQIDVVDGVRINRRPVFPSHDSSSARRALNYASFAAFASTAIEALWTADVTFVYGTPLTAAVPAVISRLTRHVPYVLQVQDLWPDSVIASEMLQSRQALIAEATIKRAASFAYRRAAAVIGISESMSRELVKRGADTSSTYTVYNWNPVEGTPRPTSRITDNGVARFLYAGNLGAMQDLETLVRAVSIAERSLSLEVLILGDGVMSERLQQLASDLDVRSLRFAGRVSQDTVEQYYDWADFSLVTLLDRSVFSMTVPSKFQASLSRGVPVVTTVHGDVTTICERRGCGFTATPGDPQSLAQALASAAATSAEERQRLSHNALETYDSLFARREAIDRIEEILVAASTRARSCGKAQRQVRT